MSGNEIQLEDWVPSKGSNKETSKEIWDKINALKSKKDFKQILQIAATMQNNLETYVIRANANFYLKRYEEAIKCCNNGLDLGDESDLWNLKGKSMGKLGNQSQKIECIKYAIQLNAKVPGYYRNIGAAYYSLKQYQNAIEYHQKAISLEPNNSINYHNKGAALLRLKKTAQALKSFERAIQLNPKLALSHSWRGDCYKQMGDYKQAIQNYSKAYELTGNEVYLKQKNTVQELAGIKVQKKKRFFGLFG